MNKQTHIVRNFFYGQYFADGLRITMGCIIPLLIFFAIDKPKIGTIMSFGGLLIGLADTPGPPLHRRIGMLTTLGLNFFTASITLLVNPFPLLMTVVIAGLSFLYSMFAVFNTRAAVVGMMATITMLINVESFYSYPEALYALLFFTAGGIGYMLISISLTQVRPYRLAQQELSESIKHVADFIRIKAKFYDESIDNVNAYNELIDQQVKVHIHQENVRELLFRSKRSIKDTTVKGRYLTLIFYDIVDLFEQSMSFQYDYQEIHHTFGPYKVLKEYKNLILKTTNELDHIAFRLNADRIPEPLYNDLDNDLEKLKKRIDEIESTYTINTLTLKKILINIRKIIGLINNLYSYGWVNSQDINEKPIQDARKFVHDSQLEFSWKNFRENLSFQSNIFRHALRISIVLSFSFFVFSKTLHSDTVGVFWILLSILTILRPGFGPTKERNIQRVLGTLVGGVMGAVILITVEHETTRFVLLSFFFLTAYSFFRINYIIFVIFMTPYVLILSSITGVGTIEVAKERIIDTFIGGSIAFISSYVIFPNWESSQIKGNMQKLLIANYNYIAEALKILQGQISDITAVKLLRKEVYISFANMGSTFQRLLTEPRWKQKNTKELNSFVILNHILASYSATLLTQVQSQHRDTFTEEHVKLLKAILRKLNKSIGHLSDAGEIFTPIKLEIPLELNELENQETKLITEQLQFLHKISSDLLKTIEIIVKKHKIEEKEVIKYA